MLIEIIADQLKFTAELLDNATTRQIAQFLPLSGNANIWGDEIYFEIPVEIALSDDAVEEVKVGDLAYWPTGKALCIFFGPTPVSTNENPRAYSPVNIFGRISEDTAPLKQITQGTRIEIRKANG
jgi:hypothetical protein